MALLSPFISGALAATSSGRLLPELVPWLLLLLGIVVASALVIYFVRRSLQMDDEVPDDGFTLHGLRQMHARGDLTDKEFERAKAALIESTRRATSENTDEPNGDDAPGAGDEPRPRSEDA